MSRLPAPSWLWNNEAHSDFTLHLITHEPAISQTALESSTSQPDTDALHGRAKASRCETSSFSAPESARSHVPTAGSPGGDQPGDDSQRPSRTYRLHTIVLSTCSQYFKTRLQLHTGELQYADTKECTSCGSRQTVMQEQIEEAQLEAMEAVLRYCYTGELSECGTDAATVDVQMLLNMLLLADRFDISACMARCSEELAVCPLEQYTFATIDAVLALPCTIQSLPSHAAAHARVAERLRQLYGDAEAVCDAQYEEDRTMFCAFERLSHAALLLLLASDRLKACSEDSVLMMADAWMNGPVGSVSNAAQRQQVAEVLRLAQLSHTFTFDVLPQLKWLTIDPEQLASLQRFAAADAGVRAAYLRNQSMKGPAAWYSSPPRARSFRTMALMHIDATKAELEAALLRPGAPAVRTLLHSRTHFFNGITHQLSVGVQAAAAPNLRCSAAIIAGGVRIHHLCVPVRGYCKLPGLAARYEWANRLKFKSYAVLHSLNRIPVALQLDITAWAPYLVDDKLAASCELRLADA